MGISEDLASVFDEIGAEFALVSTGETERLDLSATDKVGIFSVTLRSDTIFPKSCLIKETTTNQHYILYSSVSEQFENEVVVKTCRAFLCTNTAIIQSMSSIKDPVTRKEVVTFTNVETTPCYAVSPNTGNGLNSEFDNVLFSESLLRVVLQSSVAIPILSRLVIDGVKFQVSSSDTVRFPGLYFLELIEDIR